MCTLTVKLLKVVIRQPRPLGPNQVSQKSTYGCGYVVFITIQQTSNSNIRMPSTHSASISFFAAYIPLSCLYLPSHHSLPPGPGFRVLSLVTVLPWGALIVMSRVWLGHHTWPQVAVGVSYGVAFAWIWFKLWCGGLNEYGNEIEQSVQRLIWT